MKSFEWSDDSVDIYIIFTQWICNSLKASSKSRWLCFIAHHRDLSGGSAILDQLILIQGA